MKFVKRKNDKNQTEIENIIQSTIGNLSQEINPIILKTLIERGYDTQEKIEAFISPNLDNLHDPYLFKDMGKAVARIQQAINNREMIVIWGDYDVDGVTSSSSLLMALKSLGARATVYIPSRHEEGYGLNLNGFKKIQDKVDVSLLITVDCGITSKDIVEHMVASGVDVIITDHHQVPDDLPECTAIINPSNPNDTYPTTSLCGAGVVGKLLQALGGIDLMMQYVDLIALGTVCDVMPLTDENRIFVYYGLKKINENPSMNMRILLTRAFSESKYAVDEIKASHLGFNIGPMINSQGRLAHSKHSVIMLTSNDEVQVAQIANMLFLKNKERKDVEVGIIEHCINEIEKEEPKNIIIVHGENLEVGVVGIAAARLVEKYHRPAIVFSYNPETDTYSGSARSMKGINIHHEIQQNEVLLNKWGGHEAAAGLSMDGYNYALFKASMEDAFALYDDSVFEEHVYYDNEVNIGMIDWSLVDSAKVLEPCGVANPNVVYLAKDVSIIDTRVLGERHEHFKGTFHQSGRKVEFIAFNQSLPSDRNGIKAVFTLGVNQYLNYAPKIQANLSKYLEKEDDDSLVLYNEKQEGMELSKLDVSGDKEKQFNNRGIIDSETLVNYIPSRYKDYSTIYTVKEIIDQEIVDQDLAVVGHITGTHVSGKLLMAFCVDLEGRKFNVKWFNQAFRKSMLDSYKGSGKKVIFCGKVTPGHNGSVDMFPEFYSTEIESYQRITPIYKKIPAVNVEKVQANGKIVEKKVGAMSDEYLNTKMQLAYHTLQNKDYLSKDIIDKFGLVTTLKKAKSIHFPKSFKEVEDAQRRLLFDDLFKFNLSLKLGQKTTFKDSEFFIQSNDTTQKLLKGLPYRLTDDQMNTFKNIVEKINKTKKPMNGLIQGDVGSGKTIVAFLLMTSAFDNGFQGCLIAPTEILARQHYEDMLESLVPLGINVQYLHGGLTTRQRKPILEGIADGSVDIIVGTSAVLQNTVKYYNLGMVVIDEQHRFGVAQREKLLDRVNVPHMITMSATPIPRTLSMALFGDSLSVYNIKQKPAGRKDIITEMVHDDTALNERLYKEIQKGHQCYVICPLINKSTSDKMSSVRSLEVEVAAMKNYFKKHHPEVVIGVINGKMKANEINATVEAFSKNEIHILMSTTVVEVGVNVPNATIIALKSSERFGLAQSHQLRGRVGRSSVQSYCILQTAYDDVKAEILCNTSDGFELAKADLEMRGAGDYLGTQQTGSNNLVMLMLKYPELYEKIDEHNRELVKDHKQVKLYTELLDLHHIN